MRIPRVLQYVLWYIVLFFLLYTDGAMIIPGILWKIPLFIWVIIYSARRSQKCHSPNFRSVAYLWGFKNFINFGLVKYFMSNLTYLVKFLYLPVFYDFFLTRFSDKDKLFNFALLLSQYFIMVNVPLLLGLFGGRAEETHYMGFMSFWGVYSAAHTCAITISMASVFVLYYILHTHRHGIKFYYYCIVFLIAAIIIYKAFARTGWLMFLVGCVVVFLQKYWKKPTTRPVIVVAAIIGLLLFRYEMDHNQVLYNRIHDVSTTETGVEWQNESGNGRFVFAGISLAYWMEGNFMQKVFGYGMDPLMDNMEAKLGHHIYSHNGFVDALVGNGIIGVVVLLLLCASMLVFSWKNRKQEYGVIPLATSMMFTIYQIVQGGSYTYQDVLVALSLALINTKINENSIDQQRSL